MYVSGFQYDSIVDGEGLRNTIFISGCLTHCKGCHNPKTWDFKYGKDFTLDEQLKFIEKCRNNPLIDGITLSGGDPLYSPDDVRRFIKLYKAMNPTHTIWLYTSFLYEYCTHMFMDILKDIDVIVDGRFEIDKRDIGLKFKGSSNQRIIDVQKSLIAEEVTLYNLDTYDI